MDIYEYDLYTAGDECQDFRLTLGDMMHQNFPMDQTHKSDSLSEEQAIGAASDNRLQPSAPMDTAKFIIKVDWTEPFPERWRATLQKALQSCLSKLEASVLSLKLMDDQSCAEVQITPSSALEELKKQTPISLRLKYKYDKFKEVTAQIYLNEARSVTAAQKSRAPSSKVIGSMSAAVASEDTNNVEAVSASNRSPNEAETSKTAEMTSETPAVLTLPLYLSWFMHHTYGREIKQIEQQHGVSIGAEVSISINPTKSSRSDSVCKASEDFQKLVQGCVNSFSEAAINHNQMDSDIVKQALLHIQSEEARMMFTMSASNCLFFGPKNFTDTIKRGVEDTRMGRQFNDSRQTMNDMKHPKITMDRKSDSQTLLNDMKHEHFTMYRHHSQPEAIGAASDKRLQPSAAMDTAKFIIKVDWTEPFPDRWDATLQKALQICLSRLKASVLSLELMGDQSCAEVQITPSSALEELKKHTPISLRFRDKYGNSKDMTAQIYSDEACSVTAAQKSRLKENGALSSKVMGSMPVIGSFSEADIYHNQMDSDIVKPALPHIQSKDSRMMFTMSASNPFFGPKNFTDMIKRGVEDTRMGRQFNDKSIQRNKNNDLPPQSRSSLNMDTKDLPAELEMDMVHWDLMKLSYKKQLLQLETKYGVSFHEDKLQNNGTIKVQARSKGDQRFNLESHATRALTHLYQKLGSAAVTCELKYPSDATLVASTVKKLQQQHHPVVAEDVLSRWRLVGLPEHLGPAIADIEKIIKRSVFDDKKKKWIGYSGDIPHARGIKLNQTK